MSSPGQIIMIEQSKTHLFYWVLSEIIMIYAAYMLHTCCIRINPKQSFTLFQSACTPSKIVWIFLEGHFAAAVG